VGESSLQEVQMAFEALPTALTSLPDPLPTRIWLALAADDRGRASCVCRAWRDALADASLWTHLDLTGTVRSARGNREWALGAARRARGQLETLRFSNFRLTYVQEILRINALSLRELCVTCTAGNGTLAALAREAAALPELCTLEVPVKCSVLQAPRLLRAEPSFASLRLRELELDFDADVVDVSDSDDEVAAPVGVTECRRLLFEALADTSLQPSLSLLNVTYAGRSTWQDLLLTAMFVDALIARRLSQLTFGHSALPPAAQLARLLVDGALTNLCIHGQDDGLGNDEVFYSGNDATVVAAALRASPTLTSLEFKHAGLGHTAAASKTAVVLLGALVGHRTLRSLTLGGDMVFRGKVARKLGAALAAVVAADAPAFTKLDVRGPFHIRQRLDQYLLAPVLAALPHNHHLRKLDLSYNHMSEAFAREQLLPAARSNTSLRELFLCGPDDGVARPLSAAAEEAMELVRSRAR
jgi:hypothetical protein